MHLPTSIVAVLALLGTALASPIDHSPPHELTSHAPTDSDNSTVVVSRASNGQVIFTMGYALCSFSSCSGGRCNGGNREDFFSVPGKKDVGCVEHDKTPLHNPPNSNYYGMHVCNTQLNFYKQTAGSDIGNWYFFQAGGSGTKLGVCRPHDGPTRFCLELSGSCVVKTKWLCESSGATPFVCDGW